MLDSALLKLDSYFYTSLKVSVDVEKLQGEESLKLTNENVDADFSVYETSETSGCIILSLTVTTNPEFQLATEIAATVIGRFELSDELISMVKKGTAKEEKIIGNALSILYTGIRDQVFSITAKTPVGPQFLPTCVFNVEKIDEPSEMIPKRSKPTRSKKAT